VSPKATTNRIRKWGVAEWTALIQAATALVIAVLTVVLFSITVEQRADDRRGLATERIGAAVLLEASVPEFNSATKEIVVTFTNPSSRPVIGDYVEMLAVDEPMDFGDTYLGVLGPGRSAELRFSVPASSLIGTVRDLRSTTFRFSLAHVGMFGERVTQEWEWAYSPAGSSWRMSTLRIDPNVDGEPETEILL
jgi:hypothetical protein